MLHNLDLAPNIHCLSTRGTDSQQ
ncbi:hypothetical protein CTAM01_15200 [Colletotrichum tamarilloi]|uniref:Uncharacterized protein n=1 Tax=Colletotrichum tamarilloi TaxID=1209934 RepID=A0ABQ9QMB2_9PEZI|nr:hypothetical protein CSPX01_16390 [Colletotrichum filicis]KAK1477420.1 hypothetical protein CTAM01_15200 [Colletotrichum tamarilloi]